MTDKLFLGIDVGTTAIKTAVFNIDGQIQASNTTKSEVFRPQAGWSTQSLETIWKKTVVSIKTAISEVDATKIVSIGVCAQGDGLWMLNGEKQSFSDAILWSDQRAESLVLEWIQDNTSDRLSRYCRTSNWPGTAGTVFRWLKDNEPETADQAATIFFCKDWINFCLTGAISTDYSDASIPFLDLEKRTYSDDAFDLLGITELKGRLPDPAAANTVTGELTKEVAVKLGLQENTPVATGAIDLGAMMIGMGLHNTGDMCLILGTTAVLNIIIDPEPFNGPPAGATLAHPFLNKWIRVLAPTSGASALDWFTSVHPKDFGDGSPAETAERLNTVAKTAPAGSNGVVFLPYLSGERAPFVAPHASASFVGITNTTTQADISRSIMEGAALSLKHCFETTEIDKPSQIFITGGGAKNSFWCDIVANVMNTTIVASDASDHGLWGAALLGASAAELVDIEKHPARQQEIRRHVPDPESAATYENIFNFYKKNVEASAKIWEAHREMMGKI